MPRRSFVDFTSAAAGISFKLGIVAAFLVVPCTRAAYGGTARPNPPVLSALSTQLPKDNQLEARVLTATLPPHSTSVWHQHSAPVVVYVSKERSHLNSMVERLSRRTPVRHSLNRKTRKFERRTRANYQRKL